MSFCKHRVMDKCKKDGLPCVVHEGGCVEPEEEKPMTNADHIRSMTDEGLATFLECFSVCHYCSEYKEASFVEDGIPNCDGDCEKHTLDWLKQSYGGGT